MLKIYRKALLLWFITLSLTQVTYAQTKNGFDLSNSEIPVHLIKQGGPPKDGIPALSNPEFLTARKANYLNNNDRVVALSVNGESRAYPIKILNYHEIVNDVVGGMPLVVSYCPLCGSALVFKATIDNQRLSFGVSGLLYNSDVLMYDRQTNSLWSQLMMHAVTGSMKGQTLSFIEAEQTTWGDWRQRHPQTQVLSDKTGYNRDYSRSPYQGYEQVPTLFFPVAKVSDLMASKQKVLGVAVDGKFKAYSLADLKAAGKILKDNLNGTDYTINFNSTSKSATVSHASKPLVYITTYWFAWYTFHPETEVYQPPVR